MTVIVHRFNLRLGSVNDTIRQIERMHGLVW
jgi:hypothetical protein